MNRLPHGSWCPICRPVERDNRLRSRPFEKQGIRREIQQYMDETELERVPLSRVLYVAHPLGQGKERRKANLTILQTEWFPWLLAKHPNDALSCSWPMYAACLDEETSRSRGLRDDLAVLAKCDGIILCGLKITEGMMEELTSYLKRRNERGEPTLVYNYTGSILPPPKEHFGV